MFSALFYGVRCLLWFPFAVTSSLSTVVVLNVAVYIYWQHFSAACFWLSIVACGLSMPIEHTLRPAPREPKLAGPPREKPILPQLARLLTRKKGQAPSLAQARRALPKELRALLATPVTRPPEAVLYGQQLVKEQRATAAPDAA